MGVGWCLATERNTWSEDEKFACWGAQVWRRTIWNKNKKRCVDWKEDNQHCNRELSCILLKQKKKIPVTRNPLTMEFWSHILHRPIASYFKVYSTTTFWYTPTWSYVHIQVSQQKCRITVQKRKTTCTSTYLIHSHIKNFPPHMYSRFVLWEANTPYRQSLREIFLKPSDFNVWSNSKI